MPGTSGGQIVKTTPILPVYETDDELSIPIVSVAETNHPFKVEGNRIVDISYFLQQLKEYSYHQPMGCGWNETVLIKEIIKDMNSILIFNCKMCCKEIRIRCQQPTSSSNVDLYSSAIVGTMSSGGAFSNLTTLLSHMNIPPPSKKSYYKRHEIICDKWRTVAESEMRKAAQDESQLAIERGDVHEDGIPFITVVADGSWCKRSYGGAYNSLGGVGAILGYETKKLLHIAVKNKYCLSCAMGNDNHTCHKNWSHKKSSSGMESAAIVEGFKDSETKYNLRYMRIIADGDANVYHCILAARPYGNHIVEKVECTNHLLRNFCRKLRRIAELGASKNKEMGQIRKDVIDANIIPFRKIVMKSIVHRKDNGICQININLLRSDILAGITHFFRNNHANCPEHWCSLQTNSPGTDYVPLMEKYNLYEPVSSVVHYLARHSNSLLHNYNNNIAENYNALVAKYIGGKRVNFTGAGGYEARCSLAAVAVNSRMPVYNFHKVIHNSSPGLYSKRLEIKLKSLGKRKNIQKRRLFTNSNIPDKDYGPDSQRPDLLPGEFEKEKEELLKLLRQRQLDRDNIEIRTKEQSDSHAWHELRHNMLTASNFGRICRLRSNTNTANFVNSILYKMSSIKSAALAWGKEKEIVALDLLHNVKKWDIQKCGLFIHNGYPFIGASPDGLLGEDGVIEIKCPYGIRSMDPEDAIKEGKLPYFKRDGTFNVNHNYYYQVQGQLEVTNRQFCKFVVWTPNNIFISIIVRDQNFWREKMVGNLKKIFFNCLLPELIDPRKGRHMPLRSITMGSIQ